MKVKVKKKGVTDAEIPLTNQVQGPSVLLPADVYYDFLYVEALYPVQQQCAHVSRSDNKTAA